MTDACVRKMEIEYSSWSFISLEFFSLSLQYLINFFYRLRSFSVISEGASKNEMSVVSFAAAQNIVAISTKFILPNIHKPAMIFPNQFIKRQIDHVVMDGRHLLTVLNIPCFGDIGD